MAIDSGNGAQSMDQIWMHSQSLGKLMVQGLQLAVQVRQVLHCFYQQPAKMLAIEALQRTDQLRSFVLENRLRQFDQLFRFAVATANLSQDEAGRLARDIAYHRAQFDIGGFQQPLNPVDHAVPVPLQVSPPPAQVPQFTNRRRRNEASLQ